MATSKYTYIDFANEVKALANGEKVENIARLIEKADALIATQTSKADYNKAHPKASSAKGASEDTKAKSVQITAILGDSVETALTASEINARLGTEYTALQVANAMKFSEGVQSVKVVRAVKNAKGLTSEKEYTAYYRA